MLMKDKKCLVIGSGISGVGSVGLLEHMGARVVLYDSNEKLTPGNLRSRLSGDSKALCVTGEPDEQVLEGVEAAELDRLHDKLEAHKQAEQAMGPAIG